ncbi:hypothetical protein CW667_02465 [Candidatus Bathyarchaeota archaeon]|nr:MAG: hypothetical protein CW667_02465 [Candidatus Bathyarchaeota archaeon]
MNSPVFSLKKVFSILPHPQRAYERAILSKTALRLSSSFRCVCQTFAIDLPAPFPAVYQTRLLPVPSTLLTS